MALHLSDRAEKLPRKAKRKIQRETNGQLRTDDAAIVLYSSDASLYQIMPLGVYFPRSVSDLSTTIEICAEHKVPILPRGGGSSLAGQAVGQALILDISRYLDQNIEIDADNRIAKVSPGVYLSQINREAAKYGLKFGPDPASADRATVSGSIANNATGAHSLQYGMAADHLISSEVIFADGSKAILEAKSLEIARKIASRGGSIESYLYRAALDIRNNHAAQIKNSWPKVWRRSSGYSLNYLLPWSPSFPPKWTGGSTNYPPTDSQKINLAHLLAGSEGTLALMNEITVNLVPCYSETILFLVPYDSVFKACSAVPGILELEPSAIELIPGSLIKLAKRVPAYARQVDFLDGSPEALLAIEFSDNLASEFKNQANIFGNQTYLAVTQEAQNQIWNVRKVGLGILNSRPGDKKPVAFIEDMAVPVSRLDEFVGEIEQIMKKHGTVAEFYAHASAGCLHIRPILSIKNPDGVSKMRVIAEEAVEVTKSMGGAVSGEHGDGLARSEWIESVFGKGVVDLFMQIKYTADPQGIMNPGKIVDSQPLDQNLRYRSGYSTQHWVPYLNFSSQAGLAGAVELCNGAGVCRKLDGLMCPSFQATREEEHSTRGRANLLRGMIANQFDLHSKPDEIVHHAFDLCIGCKGCKAECPSSVDMAKLKYEFLHHYYKQNPRPFRDYLFANIGILAKLPKSMWTIYNKVSNKKIIKHVNEVVLGISANRDLPPFLGDYESNSMILNSTSHPRNEISEKVYYLPDPFTRFFEPQVELLGRQLLSFVGIEVIELPFLGAGRTFLSKGFLKQAKKVLENLADTLQKNDPGGTIPIVGFEPSEIYTLRDDILDLIPGAYVKGIAERSWMLEEYLIRPGIDGKIRMQPLMNGTSELSLSNGTVHLHGHCYQIAQPPAADGYPVGVDATKLFLGNCGYEIREINSGCCGMAGAFGYEADHYEISMKIGELCLFPTVRDVEKDSLIAAAGTSCRTQITDGTGRVSYHPIELIHRLLSRL